MAQGAVMPELRAVWRGPIDHAAIAASCAAGPGPRERALQDAWSGVVRARSRRVSSVWKNLALSRRTSLRVLDADAVPSTMPEGRVPDCAACPDRCCQGPGALISLRTFDIARLLDANLAWAMSATHTAAEQAMQHEDTPLAERVRAEGHWRYPVLKRTPSGNCVFYTREGTCAVHAVRPMRCARFPARLADDGSHTRWADTCTTWRDGDAKDTHALHAAAVATYNAKVHDAVWRVHGADILEAQGITPWLRG